MPACMTYLGGQKEEEKEEGKEGDKGAERQTVGEGTSEG